MAGRRGFLINNVPNGPLDFPLGEFDVSGYSVKLLGSGIVNGFPVQVQVLVGSDPANSNTGSWSNLFVNGIPYQLTSSNTQLLLAVEGRYRVQYSNSDTTCQVWLEQTSIVLDQQSIASTIVAPIVEVENGTGGGITGPNSSVINTVPVFSVTTGNAVVDTPVSINPSTGDLAANSGSFVQQPVTGSTDAALYYGAAGAHTNWSPSNTSDVIFNLNRTVQFGIGDLSSVHSFVVNPPTYAFTAAHTITNAATVCISGAPAAGTNATLTNSYALLVSSGNSAFLGILSASGGLQLHPTSVVGNYTIQSTDVILKVADTSSPWTLTLPVANSSNQGTIYIIKDETGACSLNNITIAASGGQNIDGSPTYVMRMNYESITVYSNGSNWFII